MIELFQEYVPSLKKTGSGWKGLCPFHSEKSPSFTIFGANENRYHCFGCGATGNHVDFLMRLEKLTLQEAMAVLYEDELRNVDFGFRNAKDPHSEIHIPQSEIADKHLKPVVNDLNYLSQSAKQTCHSVGTANDAPYHVRGWEPKPQDNLLVPELVQAMTLNILGHSMFTLIQHDENQAVYDWFFKKTGIPISAAKAIIKPIKSLTTSYNRSVKHQHFQKKDIVYQIGHKWFRYYFSQKTGKNENTKLPLYQIQNYLFGYETIPQNAKIIFFCEGENDTACLNYHCSVAQLPVAAVTVGGVGMNFLPKLNYLKNCFDALFLTLFDNDKSESKRAADIARSKCNYIDHFLIENHFPDLKDVCKIYEAGKMPEFLTIIQQLYG